MTSLVDAKPTAPPEKISLDAFVLTSQSCTMPGRVHHVDLSLRNIAAAESLYDLVLTHMGYVKGKPYPDGGGEWDMHDGSESIGIRPTKGPGADREHDRYSSGLHHLAWRADSPADVDALYAKLLAFGAVILDAPAEYPRYNEGRGYYAVFFADPDGLKLEYVWTAAPVEEQT